MLSRSFSLKGVFSNIVSRRGLAVTSLQYQENTNSPQLELREIKKDRTEQIPLETSLRYLQSAAYQQTYGSEPVWVPYRRNHKGGIPPRKTRKTCIRGGQVVTGNPCPICRDEYLVLHEQNTVLLKQFISPQTGAVFGYSKTGVCRKRQEELEVCIKRAYDKGLLTFDVPFRKYDYSLYYPNKE